MSGEHQQRVEDSVAPPLGDVADLDDVVIRAFANENAAAPPIVVSNVVAFVRPRREPEISSLPDITPAARPAADRAIGGGRLQFASLVALSLLVHAGLYFVFNREPEPMASIGLEAISVEIVLGADMPAGVAAKPGESDTQTAPANDPDPNPADNETATAKTEQAEEARPVEEARVVPPEPTIKESPPVEENPPEPQVEEKKPEPVAETPPERTEPQPQAVAALPAEPTPAPPEPEPPPPQAAKPAPDEPIKPEVTPPAAKPKPPKPHATKPKTEPEAKPKPERPGPRTRTASTEPTAPGPRANAASGVGPGSSQNDTNYRGLVAAHLARYKRYPAEARSRGDQGTAVVSFSLDGGGRVTRVALGRGSGFASLDAEVQAMVHRASPFPAPPDARAKSFTVPVTFRVQ